MRPRLTVHSPQGLVILAVVVAVIAAACTAGSVTTTASTTTTTTATMIPPANRVGCSGVIDTLEDAPDFAGFSERILDVVALPSVPLDVGRDGEPGTAYEGLRFAKFGLVIRADRAITLEIIDVQPGTAVMAWIPMEDPDRPVTRVEVGPCPGDGADWIVFSGGLWVSDEPTCVTLAVTADRRTEQVRIGVEAPCP